MFESALIIVAIASGIVASISGFGIGSLITPLLAVRIGTKIAVAAVSIPHFCGTALRLWFLRKNIDRKILWSFGLTSAAGGLTGAILHIYFSNILLTLIFGILLTFAGFMGITGLAEKLEFKGKAAWIAGALSGLLGGLVGNQGGIRSAAMLGLKVSKDSFVATASAIALIIDISRMPVYIFSQAGEIAKNSFLILLSIIGVLIGTLLGQKILKFIPEKIFKRIISLIILALGIWMLFKSFNI